MLWTILVVLSVLWLLGFLGGFVTTNLIHLVARGGTGDSCDEYFLAPACGIRESRSQPIVREGAKEVFQTRKG